eukprot:6214097-Pleurochrysis_carterae.AAC.1
MYPPNGCEYCAEQKPHCDAMAAAPSQPLPMADVADCPTRINGDGYLKEDNQVSSYALSWVQPSISGPDRPDDDLIKYSQVIITTKTARLTVGVGDCVYVTVGKDGPAEIGKVISLYDAGPDEENAKMFEVQWFWRKEHFRTRSAFARSMHQRELLLGTDEPDQNYIDSIEWLAGLQHGRKVNVLFYKDEESAAAELNKPHTFFCNKLYNPKKADTEPLEPPVPSAPPTHALSAAAQLSGASSQSAGVSMPEHPQPATPSAAPAHSTEEGPSAPSLPTDINGTFAVPAVPTAASSSHSSIPPGAPVVTTPAVPSSPVDAPSVAHADAAPASAESRPKRRVTVSYSDFLALKEEVSSLRSLVAAQKKLEDRLALLESMVVCPSSSASSACSVPSSQSHSSSSS